MAHPPRLRSYGSATTGYGPTCRSGGDTRVSSEDLVQCGILLVDCVKHQDVTVLVVYVQNVRHQDLTQEPEIRDETFYFMKNTINPFLRKNCPHCLYLRSEIVVLYSLVQGTTKNPFTNIIRDTDANAQYKTAHLFCYLREDTSCFTEFSD